MALSRDLVVDAAIAHLEEHDLASLSMRALARSLDVQVGALYWHVENKQHLLALVAGRLLAPLGDLPTRQPLDARSFALAMRDALNSVRDGAEVVSLASAFRPDALEVMSRLAQALSTQLAEPLRDRGARVLWHYVLGAVAEEQNARELARAGILPDRADADADESFAFGVDVILRGLETS